MIYYNDVIFYVSDYNNYIISLLETIIKKNNLSIDIFFSNYNTNELENIKNTNSKKILKIYCNYEHTLIKTDVTSNYINNLDAFFHSIIPNYLVRIENYNFAYNSDIIIEYSIQNIQNIKLSKITNDIVRKMVLIHPCLYKEHELCKKSQQRNIQCLTTFIDYEKPRRKNLLHNLKLHDIANININNCFNKDELQKLYLTTKIMINIHQTDFHHTLEELRVLPALQCGVIVICEKTKINDHDDMKVIYDDYIIWETYDNIVTKTKDILDNYDYYFKKIFMKPKHVDLYKLHDSNYSNLEKVVLDKLSNLL